MAVRHEEEQSPASEGVSAEAVAQSAEPLAPPRKKARRGFAAMDPAKQKELAARGGKASHAKGTGHEWTSAAAKAAGRKGGLASHGGRGKQAGPKASEK
jgi:general stress protein YciG